MEAPSTRLHVDELILDYLLWYCTSSLLAEHRLRTEGHGNKREHAEASRNCDMGMKLVNSFFQTFTRVHPHSPLPEPISLRLQICRFAATLLRRIDVTAPDFAPNISARRRRTENWLQRRGAFSVLPAKYTGLFSAPFSAATLQRNSEALLESLGHTPGALYGSATLCDALWEYLLMTARISARDGEVTSGWISNTVEFMMQATLEAYRCYGCSGVEAVNEGFAFGLMAMGDSIQDDTIEEIVVNEMFAGDEGDVGSEFEELSQQALEEILPPRGVSLEKHFESLAAEYPWMQFEDSIVKCLMVASKSQSRPVLAQLEQGRLEGFDTHDIRLILANAGVSPDVWR